MPNQMDWALLQSQLALAWELTHKWCLFKAGLFAE